MTALDRTSPHYIRCVKPNSQKAPAPVIDGRMTSEQLLYSGVFETVAIQRSGMPLRSPHRRFAMQ